MSANDFRQCPNCLKLVRNKYGKVSEDEYNRLLNKAQNASIAEYYEIWTNKDGKFTVDYSCVCDTCGFEFNYKHEEQVI